MKTLVIAEFPAKKGGVKEVEQALRAALPETRAFDGCLSLQTFYHAETETFTLIEDWESPEHYDRYLGWRMENGLADLLEGILEGGAAGFSVRKFQTTDI